MAWRQPGRPAFLTHPLSVICRVAPHDEGGDTPQHQHRARRPVADHGHAGEQRTHPRQGPEHYYRVHVAGPRRAPHGSKDVGESYARPDSERHTAEADEHDGRVAPSRSAKGAPG